MSIVTIFIIFSFAIAELYYLVILSLMFGLNRAKTFHVSHEPFKTRVSVIIPARNEQLHILNCLDDLRKQEYPSGLTEVILVDDGSTDDTADSTKKFAERNPSFPFTILKLNPEDGSSGGKKRAISYAVSRSSGDLILTTDADIRMGSLWISGMVSFYEKHRPEMILGPVAYADGPGLFSKMQVCEFMGMMAATDGTAALRRPLMCNGANLAYTRDAFEQVRGFTGNMDVPSGDDMFLMMKIRKKFGKNAVMFNRSAETVVLTEPNRNLGEFLHQRLRWVSKNRSIRNPLVLLVAVITYLFNAILLLGMAGCFFYSRLWILFVILFAGKLAVEFPVMRKYAVFLGKTDILRIVPLVQFVNIFYVTIVGLLGNFLSSEWKGRIVRPGTKH